MIHIFLTFFSWKKALPMECPFDGYCVNYNFSTKSVWQTAYLPFYLIFISVFFTVIFSFSIWKILATKKILKKFCKRFSCRAKRKLEVALNSAITSDLCINLHLLTETNTNISFRETGMREREQIKFLRERKQK